MHVNFFWLKRIVWWNETKVRHWSSIFSIKLLPTRWNVGPWFNSDPSLTFKMSGAFPVKTGLVEGFGNEVLIGLAAFFGVLIPMIAFIFNRLVTGQPKQSVFTISFSHLLSVSELFWKNMSVFVCGRKTKYTSKFTFEITLFYWREGKDRCNPAYEVFPCELR